MKTGKESPDESRHHLLPAVEPAPGASVIEELIAAGKKFSSSNWVLGTAGNFSGIVCRQPFRLAITVNGARKGRLTAGDFLQVDESGRPCDTDRLVPAEAPLHCAIVSERGAGAILHTHSVWSTILSDLYAASGGLSMYGFEMLRGLHQVESHQHQEWLPILENSEDYTSLSRVMSGVLKNSPEVHGILIRKYGLYTWGRNVDEATRHVEILEFLFEVLGRQLHIMQQIDKRKKLGKLNYC
jgi:methylthioribulose-1-phosphate dehydratase